jgi:hypothetical protein
VINSSVDQQQGEGYAPLRRFDDDEERPRRRRDRYQEERDERDRYDDEDDYDRPRRRGAGDKSGAVTAVGVVNIVLGSLVALLSMCILLGGLFFAGAAADLNQFGPKPNPARGVFGLVGGLAIVMGVMILLYAVGLITSGIGVLHRRNWARILTLVLAGFTAVGALWHLVNLIQLIGINVPGTAGVIMSQLLVLLLEIGYVVMAFTILLNSRYAEEFR